MQRPEDILSPARYGIRQDAAVIDQIIDILQECDGVYAGIQSLKTELLVLRDSVGGKETAEEGTSRVTDSFDQ